MTTVTLKSSGVRFPLSCSPAKAQRLLEGIGLPPTSYRLSEGQETRLPTALATGWQVIRGDGSMIGVIRDA